MDPQPDPTAPIVPTTPSALPAELCDMLHDALTPDAPDPVADQRLKRRLLQTLAREATASHLTVPPGDEGWRAFAPGIQMKLLHRDGLTAAYLLRMAAGATIPPHRHPQDEECVVLEGQLRIGSLQVPCGGFHLARRGALHESVQAPAGALIYLRGALPDEAQLI
jgi:quercetin dioxygenase-like cupin family protein